MYYSVKFLIHHGIKGQSWGKRNGPPYPLDYKKHSTLEKKLNSKSELTKNNKKKRQKNQIKNTDDFVKYYGTSILQDFATKVRVENGLASYKPLADGLTKHGFWDADSDYEDNDFQSHDERIFTTGKRKDVLNEYDIDTINSKNYISDRDGKNGYRSNCMQASIAAELRLDGFKNFEAGPSLDGNRIEDVTEYFNGSKINSFNNLSNGSDVKQHMLNEYGNNTSGIMGVKYTIGSMTKKFNLSSSEEDLNDHTILSGHALHWQIDNDGNFSINDMQNGTQYYGDKALNYFQDNAVDLSVGLESARLDNTTPNVSKMLDNGIITAQHNKMSSKLYEIEDEREYDKAYKEAKLSETTAYKSYGGTTYNDYGKAYSQTKKDLYDDYRNYKKQNYGV